jgi:glycosyltransferase involved in cell wall biosynthesis
VKLRIALLRRECISTIDGVNRFIFSLADGLRVLGNEVFIISYSGRGLNSPEGDIRSFFGVEEDFKIYSLIDTSTSTPLPKVGISWITAGSGLLKNLDLDAIILNGIAPLRTNVLKISVTHGLRSLNAASWKTPINQLNLQIGRFLYRKYSDYRVCISEGIQKEFQALIGLKSSVIPLPLKLHFFKNSSFSTRENSILHIGTRSGKNAEVSIKAVNFLVDKMKIDATLTIVGPKSDYILNLFNKYSQIMGNRLNFVFDADMTTISDLLSHSQALLLPSKYEGTPYSILEAFASGVPVIVSQAVPKEMVLNGYNGFRIEGFNYLSYAAKLMELMTNSNNWVTFSKNAFESAQKYSYISVARQYEKVISQTVNKN